MPDRNCRAKDAEREAYFSARHEGLAFYCSGERVFGRARLGERVDFERCPVEWQATARAADLAGHRLFRSEQEIRKLRAQARSLEEQRRFAEVGGFDQRAGTLQDEVDDWIERAIEQGWLAAPERIADPPVGTGSVLAPDPAKAQ